jgi:phosphoenolpyruvate-protein kinase (PTS system EI component)
MRESIHMMHLEGNPISPGHASGIATICDYEIERRFELPHRAILHAEVESECIRLSEALEQSSQDLKCIQQTALSDSRLVEFAALLSAHSTMANECELLGCHPW